MKTPVSNSRVRRLAVQSGLSEASVRGILEGVQESKSGKSVPYKWGVLKKGKRKRA